MAERGFCLYFHYCLQPTLKNQQAANMLAPTNIVTPLLLLLLSLPWSLDDSQALYESLAFPSVTAR